MDWDDLIAQVCQIVYWRDTALSIELATDGVAYLERGKATGYRLPPGACVTSIEKDCLTINLGENCWMIIDDHGPRLHFPRRVDLRANVGG